MQQATRAVLYFRRPAKERGSPFIALDTQEFQAFMGREGSVTKTKEFVRVKRSNLEKILSLLSTLEDLNASQ